MNSKTIDQMNRRLFPSLYVEVTNKEHESRYEDDPDDSGSLDTQPDEQMN